MAFTAKILSWRFRDLNIVGCLLKRRPTGGGGGHGHRRTPPPLATPLTTEIPLPCGTIHVYQVVNFVLAGLGINAKVESVFE